TYLGGYVAAYIRYILCTSIDELSSTEVYDGSRELAWYEPRWPCTPPRRARVPFISHPCSVVYISAVYSVRARAAGRKRRWDTCRSGGSTDYTKQRYGVLLR